MRPKSSRRNRNRDQSNDDLMQRIIIPRGMVQAGEVVVIEIPKKYQKAALVVAKRKNATGAYSVTATNSQQPYCIEVYPQPAQPTATLTTATFMPPLQAGGSQNNPPQGAVMYQAQYSNDNQSPMYATNIPSQSSNQPQIMQPSIQGVIYNQPMALYTPTYTPMPNNQQMQQNPSVPYTPITNDTLSQKEQAEKVSVGRSLDDFQKARRGFLANTQKVLEAPQPKLSSTTSMDSSHSSDESFYPCDHCQKYRQK